jgi:hypothetical protein
MVAAAAALFAVQGISQVVGGVIARAAAKNRAEYFADLQMEQARTANFYARRITAENTGAAVAAVGGRGVALEGSPLDMIISNNFNEQIKRTMAMQDARIQMEQTKLGGAAAGSNALQQGIGGAMGTATKAIEYGMDNKAAR